MGDDCDVALDGQFAEGLPQRSAAHSEGLC